MRKQFFQSLHEEMKKNPLVYALTGDLGYIGFDAIQKDFPDRFINCGAAEQSMITIAVGLAQSGKIPVCYSITPFLIYRPFEAIKLYLNGEHANVKLIGSGRDTDYAHDGPSHDATDIEKTLQTLPNIVTMWPKEKEDIPTVLNVALNNNRPTFISLRR